MEWTTAQEGSGSLIAPPASMVIATCLMTSATVRTASRPFLCNACSNKKRCGSSTTRKQLPPCSSWRRIFIYSNHNCLGWGSSSVGLVIFDHIQTLALKCENISLASSRREARRVRVFLSLSCTILLRGLRIK